MTGRAQCGFVPFPRGGSAGGATQQRTRRVERDGTHGRTTPVPNPPRGATGPVTLRRPPQPESGRGWASPPPRDLLSR